MYKFHCEGTLDAPFLVRIPGWCQPPHFYKCGGKVEPVIATGNLAEIAGPWKEGDTLEVALEQKVALASDRHWHWLRRGALTLAYPVKTRIVEEKPSERFSDLRFEDPAPFNFAFDLDEIAKTDLKAEFRPSRHPFAQPNLIVKVPMRD